MATSTVPVIELSSDSENGFSPNLSQTQFECYGSQPVDDVFTLDWEDNDYPPISADIVNDDDEPVVVDKDNVSISSAETEIYVPTIDDDDTIIYDYHEKTCHNPTEPVSVIAKTKETRQDEKLLKQQKRLEQKRVREEKKAEELKQKKIKAAIAQHHKNLKPEENIKLITVNIDTNIVNSEFGGIVVTMLQQSGIHYVIGNLTKSDTVSWTKEVKEILVSDEGVIQADLGCREEDQLIYLMNIERTLELVHSGELLTHLQVIKSTHLDKSLIVVFTGTQKYFDAQKKKRKCNSNGSGQKKNRKNAEPEERFSVTFEELEWALIELQLVGKFNYCLIEKGEELASLIITTTKSLSQLDYKKEKYKREEGELEWFAKADSKQCVKVDKQGNGLMKLWQQQLSQFGNVGVEMAAAICSNFHSPSNLVKEYKNCSSKSEAELLLQNIKIRRNAGFLSSNRRIGPEASKKLYNFYMSDDPELEL